VCVCVCVCVRTRLMSVECGELRDCCVVSTIQYTHHCIQNGPSK